MLTKLWPILTCSIQHILYFFNTNKTITSSFCFLERLKREEQGRLEQEKWKRRMEAEAVEAQEQMSDLSLLSTELRNGLSQREKEITTLQTRYTQTQPNVHC